MSAGRRAVNLADLQAAKGRDEITRITRWLLQDTGAVAPPPPPRVCTGPQPLEPRRMHRFTTGEWQEWMKPADWRWRTTPEDVLADAVELARDRLPFGLSVLLDAVAHGDTDVEISGHERSQVEAMIRKCRIEVMRTLARTPGRKPQRPPRHRPRWEGACSPVRTVLPDGRMFVDGREVEDWWPEDFEPAKD